MADSAPHILVVDDEPPVLHVVATKLRAAGYRVSIARDGADALQLATTGEPDLLITDYRMPRIDGLELAERLRECMGETRPPVIMLTAREFQMGEDALLRAAVSAVVTKPFSPRDLINQVELVLALEQDAARKAEPLTGQMISRAVARDEASPPAAPSAAPPPPPPGSLPPDDAHGGQAAA